MEEIQETIPETPAINENPTFSSIPQVPNVLEPAVESTPPKENRKRRVIPILVVFAILLIFLFGGGAALAYGITYNKVNIGNKDVKKAVSSFVLSLPFTPKTPEYVLVSAFNAHKKVTSNEFDISLAVSSSDNTQILSQIGYSNFDLGVKGRVDFLDSKNITGEANISISGDANADVLWINNQVYFKVNKIPSLALTFLGVDKDSLDSLLNTWVKYEPPKLDTEARKLVDEIQNDRSDEDRMGEFYDKLREQGVFDKMQITSDTFEDLAVYKITTSLTGEEIDAINDIVREIDQTDISSGVKSSDYLSSPLNLELLVGKKDMLVRKFSISSSITSPELGGNYDAAFVGKFSNYNVPVELSVPEVFLTTDEYLQKILNIMQTASPESSFFPLINPGAQFSKARDTQRQADLLSITNAIYEYAIEHNGNLPGGKGFPTTPTCIGTSKECFDLGASGSPETIVPTYLSTVPYDPSTGSGTDTRYIIYVDQNGRINASAVGEETTDITVTR